MGGLETWRLLLSGQKPYTPAGPAGPGPWFLVQVSSLDSHPGSKSWGQSELHVCQLHEWKCVLQPVFTQGCMCVCVFLAAYAS